MRGAGLLLVVAGVAVFLWLGILDGPDPEWLCGDGPNVLVATIGYGGDDDEFTRGCVASARRELIQAGIISAVLAVPGAIIAQAGVEAERRAQAERQAAAVRASYGARSPDGAWWWDGHHWCPVPPDQR